MDFLTNAHTIVTKPIARKIATAALFCGFMVGGTGMTDICATSILKENIVEPVANAKKAVSNEINKLYKPF